MSTKQSFCSECGVPLEKTDHFCPTCGAKVTDNDEKTVPNEKESKDTFQSRKNTTPLSQENKKKSKFRLWLTIPVITIISFASYVLFIAYQTGGDLLPSVRAVSFSPTNNKLVSAGSDNHLEIWDITKAMSIKRKKFASSYGIHRALAWSPNNQMIALARVNPIPIDNEIIIFDSRTLTQISSLSTGSSVPIALCIDTDGETLYSVSMRLGVSVWNINEGKKMGGMEDLPDRLVTSASFDNDCQKIVTVEGTTTTQNGFSTTDDKLVVYQRINMDTLFDTRLDDMKTTSYLVGLGFNGETVKLLEPYSKKFQSLNIHTYSLEEKTLGKRQYAKSLAIGKEEQIAIGYGKGLIEVFDSSGNYKHTLQHGPAVGILLAPILDYFD